MVVVIAMDIAMVMVFNATFNNISDISWRSVLLVEETGGPGENHRPVGGNQSTQRKPPTCRRKPEYPEKTTDLSEETRIPRENHRPVANH